jgi:hypothetical protein
MAAFSENSIQKHLRAYILALVLSLTPPFMGVLADTQWQGKPFPTVSRLAFAPPND